MGTCGVHGRTVAELAACADAELRAGDSAAEQARNVRILGVSEDHTEVHPGDLFVALQGRHHHGAGRVAEAVAAGAGAVLTDAAGARSIGRDPGVPLLVAEHPRAALGPLASLLNLSLIHI